MIVKYMNHNGQEINLFGDGVFMNVTDFLAYSQTQRKINKRVVGYERDAATYNAACAIADTVNARALRDKILKIAAVDIEARRYGKLYFNNWYLMANLTGIEWRNWWHDPASLRMQIIDDGTGWHRDKSYTFGPKETTGGGIDYPYDFMYDYQTSYGDTAVYNAGITGAEFHSIIDGPVTNPSVIIGDNTYRVNTTIADGERLEIDSARRTVELVTQYGDRINKFADIDGEYRQGSGSYIFEPIKPGYSTVQWDESTHTNVTVIEGSAVPQWT